MAGNKKAGWKLVDLEKLSQDELYAILDEIPSGSESEGLDVESEVGEGYLEANNLPETDLLDIQNMDIILEEENDMAVEVDADMGWESEDDVSLARLATNQSSIWTNNENYATTTNPFIEVIGPNLIADVETPTDVFLSLYPGDLIQHIVFQTKKNFWGSIY
ncbi:unnamed protein product [Acanthoscelides obtectus]|uniref:Uncharacterized protein n=1 Tax=Acanthoscelides obtectus TaxID=200917 RepID=A0A9P0L5S0_ACAOB|nr:unnamed protein product [Acanthoscelides obtectus]CAK1681023.1 hypothetical protein AOBTE_LOCUS32982 [Acanthoscelides obtectus]